MEPIAHNTLLSGVEPVDKLFGGLEKGQLYLVHGEASGKSLFGIQFLVEGLKRGENGALVTRYSPEDAVRRFARLGYDCLEDIHSGRLLILEYSDEIIQQMSRLREITPVLRELEWLLGETRPQRLIFDPVTNLVVSQTGELESRAREFTEWAKSFGATVLLVANGDSDDVIEAFNPLVEESFRFAVRETAERAVRYIAFEKTSFVPDQPVEVDPTRGIFLLGQAQARSTARDTSPLDKAQSANAEKYDKAASQEPAADLLDLTIELDLPEVREASEAKGDDDDQFTFDRNLQTPLDLGAGAAAAVEDESSRIVDSAQRKSAPSRPTQASRARIDMLSDLIKEIESEDAPLDLDELEIEAGAQEIEIEASQQSPPAQEPGTDSTAEMARAVEMLLRPPDIKTASPSAQAPESEAARATAQAAVSESTTIDPKNFNVLVIDDDAASCEAIKQTLGDYTVETVTDAVSGVIKLMSLKPDLVILDVELPVIDGFELLKKIRSSLDLPMIVISSSHLRANDRILSAELGADYYLTRPFSALELRQKARQLIARYRGISSWIVNPFVARGPRASAENRGQKEINSDRLPDQAGVAAQPASVQFVSYDEFAAQIETNVKTALDNGSSFSVVGCRLPEMTASGGRAALKLFEMVSSLVRDTDLISTNTRNDIVILLADADVAGAQAFINRLRERAIEDIEQEPIIWMRSFPDLEEAYDSTRQGRSPIGNSEPGRRAGDKRPNRRSKKEPNPASRPAFKRRATRSAPAVTMSSEYAKRRDPRESYIDFLERL